MPPSSHHLEFSSKGKGDPLDDTKLFGLSVACPYCQSNPVDCPLYELRKKPIAERYKEIRDMDEREKRFLLLHHSGCLHSKELPITSPKEA